MEKKNYEYQKWYKKTYLNQGFMILEKRVIYIFMLFTFSVIFNFIVFNIYSNLKLFAHVNFVGELN